MEKTFIFGHRKPDTDSITAAIALSYLKNQLGKNTEPRMLGDITDETKFVLDYFNVPVPKYLNDVKLQLKDINYKKNASIKDNESVFETYLYMMENKISTLPIIDENDQFLGIVSMKDIAKDMINGEFNQLHTSYDNLLDALGANGILKFDNEINGRISVASYRSTTFIETVEITPNTILIVGDRHSIIEYAVNNKAKMIILSGNSYIKEEHIKIAEKNKVNIIRTDLPTFEVAKKIGLANYISNITTEDNIICFNDTDYVNDFIEIANKTKYSNYPVLTKDKKCLGIVKLADIADKNKKKVILVDHNEAEQSVEGLEEAEILEIIDHHKIGTIGTTLPINFRNMPVGSSNTIIYQLYQENHITIPKEIAGLMLSGIVSDTLLLKSPTTTESDKEAIEKLSKIAEVDFEEYGMQMFKAGSSLAGKTTEDILYTDFKNFTIEEKKVGVGQIFTLDIDEIKKEQNKYIQLLNDTANHNDYYIIALFVTDIINNGSYMFYNDKAKDILEQSFKLETLQQGHYLQDCVSRKKQIIPAIMDAMEKNK